MAHCSDMSTCYNSRARIVGAELFQLGLKKNLLYCQLFFILLGVVLGGWLPFEEIVLLFPD